MNTGARLILALTAGASFGAIVLAYTKIQDVDTNGVPLKVPIVGQVTITPSLAPDNSSLMIAGGVALAVAVLAFAVAG